MAIGKSYEVTTIMYNYESYKEHSVVGRYVRHLQVREFLKKLKTNSHFEIKNIGYSFEKREINLVKVGSGNTKVFFWSQMHGDETTSTRAILDLLNFFASGDENQAIRDKILRNITLYIIPMLNPDGAENFTRQNAQVIDINRDAVALQSPEGRILYKTKNEINPHWGFNLHDQSSGYSAGLSYKSSTISLLAPPFNAQRDLNDNRIKAIQLIVSVYNELEEIIPGHVARYDDEFEPRAFGDNFTKDGLSTILIEAGGWNTDPDREYVRKLFFLSLIKSLLTISNNSFMREDAENYSLIPENKERLYDLMLRNVSMNKNNRHYKVDIAVKREPCFDYATKKIYYIGKIADIGDLSTFFGYEEHDMNSSELMIPQINVEYSSDYKELLKKGCLYTKIKSPTAVWTEDPINYFSSRKPATEINIDALANFSLSFSGRIKYVVVNGFLLDLDKTIDFNGNSLILS